MMVADYKVYPFLLSVGNLIDCLDTTIQNYYQLHIIVCGIINAFQRNSVALFIARGNVILDVAVIILKIFVDKSHGRGAIHIVVTIDHYLLFGTHGLVEPVDRLIHVGHQKWVMKIGY